MWLSDASGTSRILAECAVRAAAASSSVYRSILYDIPYRVHGTAVLRLAGILGKQ